MKDDREVVDSLRKRAANLNAAADLIEGVVGSRRGRRGTTGDMEAPFTPSRRGGRRPGAGRPKGSGRKKATKSAKKGRRGTRTPNGGNGGGNGGNGGE